jgi:hypothetical protein
MFRNFMSGCIGLMIALPAFGQYYTGSNNYAPPTTQGYARGLAGSQNTGQNITNFSVGGGYGGYWGGGGAQIATPWSSQYGGWIQPASSGVEQDDIARQQANFQGAFQNQDLRLRQLQLKQATFDEMRYEQMNTPPPEVVREEQRLSQLALARSAPPEHDIWTGEALNSLLQNIQMIEAREKVRGYEVPLNKDVVEHLNVSTTNDNSGSNAFFKGPPDWPIAFIGDEYASDRTKIQDDLAAMASAQLAGRVDQVKVVDIRKEMGILKSQLYDKRLSTSFTDYANALGFLNKLEDAVNIMAKPGAKPFIDGGYSAQGSTVGELVKYMTNKGLKFSSATPGFEPYYTAFYQRLVTYDIGLSRMVGDHSTHLYSEMKR